MRGLLESGPIIGADDTIVTFLTPKEPQPLDPKSARTREVGCAVRT